MNRFRDNLYKVVIVIEILYLAFLLYPVVTGVRMSDSAGPVIFCAILCWIGPGLYLIAGYSEYRRLGHVGFTWTAVGISAAMYGASYVPGFMEAISCRPGPRFVFNTVLVMHVVVPVSLMMIFGLRRFLKSLTLRGVGIAIAKTILTVIVGLIGAVLTILLFRSGIFSNSVVIMGGVPFVGLIFAFSPAVLAGVAIVGIWNFKV